MATMKTLYFEYRDLIEQIEFGNRTPESKAAYDKWFAENRANLESMGIHPLDLFDEIYEELRHIYEPTAKQDEIISQWKSTTAEPLRKQGIKITDTDTIIDALAEDYLFGGSSDLQHTLNAIAKIPLMTAEVMQSLIYKAIKKVPLDTVIGLDKVTIPKPM